jgi:hypothetical protein
MLRQDSFSKGRERKVVLEYASDVGNNGSSPVTANFSCGGRWKEGSQNERGKLSQQPAGVLQDILGNMIPSLRHFIHPH